jgi:hypothetical protein
MKEKGQVNSFLGTLVSTSFLSSVFRQTSSVSARGIVCCELAIA